VFFGVDLTRFARSLSSSSSSLQWRHLTSFWLSSTAAAAVN